MHFRRARFAQQRDDARRRRAAHDRIVDDDHALAAQILDDRIELQLHAAIAHLLIGADEGAPDVAVLDQPFDVRQAALGRVTDRRRESPNPAPPSRRRRRRDIRAPAARPIW